MLEHNLFGKPVPTFPDHALGAKRVLGNIRNSVGAISDAIAYNLDDGICRPSVVPIITPRRRRKLWGYQVRQSASSTKRVASSAHPAFQARSHRTARTRHCIGGRLRSTGEPAAAESQV